MTTTGFVWHERYMWHDTGHAAAFFPAGGFIEPDEHVENPSTKRRLRNLLEVSGLLDRLIQIQPRYATFEEIVRFHTPEYVSLVERVSKGRGELVGENTVAGPDSYDIARLAVGGCLAALDAVLDGKVSNAYALVRPPGHHAEAGRARGFCIFNNVVLSALHAIETRNVGRIAIVDWDVHHGNGTQKAFYNRSDVLTISLHQDNNYPQDSGDATEVGEGPGQGFNINVPLPPGSGRGAYLYAFDQVVVPALREYRPEVVLVSSGLDAGAADPLAHMMLYSDVYREMTRVLMEVADEVCGGRMVLCHEGGYSPAYVPFCGLAVVETLAGTVTDVDDPFREWFSAFGGQELQEHQRLMVNHSAESALRYMRR